MSNYKFLNINPLGKREKDCVCRAISLATNIDYYSIERKLELVGELFECEKLCVCCYKFLLDNVFGFKRMEEFKGYTVGEFSEIAPRGVYLVRVDEHLTCIINNEICDIWNCSEEIVDLIWIVDV